MWNKIIIKTTQLGAIVMIFIAPIVYLLWKYGGSETQIVEITTNSMPITILLLISAFVLVIIMWLGSQIIVVYWNYIKTHPFGSVSTMTFGGLILAVTLLGIQWVNKFIDVIQANADQFTSDLTVYRGSMNVILIYVGVGLLLSVISYVWEKAT